MKKRKANNKKLKNNKKIIIIIAIIVLIIALFFIAIKFTGQVVGQVTGQITGDATSTAIYNCTDSDNGVNYFEKGFCQDHKQQYTDQCYGERGLWEYYCGNDRYACIRQETACPYGCLDGRCLKKGENATVIETNPSNDQVTNNPVDNITKENSPNEEITKSYLKVILIILGIIIIAFLGWLIFIKKPVRFKRSSVKLTWR